MQITPNTGKQATSVWTMEPKAKQVTQKYFTGAVFSVEATCSNMEIQAWISPGASRRGWFSSLCPLAVLIL